MARENQRKRDERRFGRPERLADIVGEKTWLISPRLTVGDFAIDSAVDAITQSQVFSIDNVVEYFNLHFRELWTWTEFPPIRLPFPSVFLEAHSPLPHLFDPDEKFGVLMVESDDSRLEVIRSEVESFGAMGTRLQDDMPVLLEHCKHIIDYMMILYSPAKDRVVGPFSRGTFFLNADWVPLRAPVGNFDRDVIRDQSEGKAIGWMITYPSALALAFMNCRNVSLPAVDPPVAINRERRKHGFRPFVRYHTINIEPVKHVLKAEGRIDEVGLSRALHIVRGHFARYPDTFMGRPLPAPLTVWRPAHVRGSAREGVVISDYAVHPPTRVEEGCTP